MESSNPFLPGNAVDGPGVSGNDPEAGRPVYDRIIAVAIVGFFSIPAGLGLWWLGWTKRFRFWGILSLLTFTTLVAGGALDQPFLAGIGFCGLFLAVAGAFTETLFRKPLPRASRPLTIAVVSTGLSFFVALIPLRRNVLEGFSIPAGSMIPSLAIGDNIWVYKLDEQYRRGDLVVFDYPLDRTVQYIKRIVGLPGETIAGYGNSILVNGKPLNQQERGQCDGDEDRHRGDCRTVVESDGDATYPVMLQGEGLGFSETKIPDDSYFVMGDNRANSNDSRIWGFVPRTLIKGKAQFIYWSRGSYGVRVDRIGRQVGRVME
jgi:signal peptidase I